MFAKAFSVFAISAAAMVAAQGGGDEMTVPTPPNVGQCRPLKITWKGGQGPFYPQITKPGDISSVIKDFGEVKSNEVTWKVSVPQGQKFTIHVSDSQGNQQSSGEVGPVGGGSDSCIKGGDKGSSGGGGAAAGGGSQSKGGDKDSKSSSQGGKSSSSQGGKSSSSGGDKSSSAASKSSGGAGGAGGSSSQGGKSSSSGPEQSSSGGGAAAGGGSSSQSGDKSQSSDKSEGGDKKDNKSPDDAATTFSGVPAIVAGVVGVVVAALL